MNISIFYEKQDPYKTIKDLTYHIGNVGTELKGKNQNRQDIDIAAFTYNDAKYIRKEIQVNNEDLYFLYIYINVYSENKKELEFNLNKIEGIAQSKGMQTRRANFRQEELFLSCLPIMQNNEKIKNAARRNILTSGLLATYPFISSNIFDVNGIFIGKNIYNNSMVFIDRYNTNKYKNANMCIFGTSGAGKSFYTKLLILRYKLMGIKQYIIDPDREYHKLCNELNGTLIKIGPTSNTYINVLEIRKESIEDGENGYLATKIGKLIGFFNLIFGELNEEEKAIIEEKLIETYKRKNITFNDNSLYKQDPEKIIGKIFKENKDMQKDINIIEDCKTFCEKYGKEDLENIDIYNLKLICNLGNGLLNNYFITKDTEKNDITTILQLEYIIMNARYILNLKQIENTRQSTVEFNEKLNKIINRAEKLEKDTTEEKREIKHMKNDIKSIITTILAIVLAFSIIPTAITAVTKIDTNYILPFMSSIIIFGMFMVIFIYSIYQDKLKISTWIIFSISIIICIGLWISSIFGFTKIEKETNKNNQNVSNVVEEN